MTSDVDRRILSDTDIEHFRTQGYLGPFTVYDPDEMDRRWHSIRLSLLDRTYAAYPSDASSGLTNIANYDRHLDVDELSEHVMHPEIVGRIKELIGPDLMCWRTEFFPKRMGDPGTAWHQSDTFANPDGTPQILWPDDAETQFGKGTITVWTAFTDATLINGCLRIIPGSHLQMNYDEAKGFGAYDPDKKDFFGYDYRDLQIDPSWAPDEASAIPLVMRKGECVIFWEALLHSSLPHTGTARDHRMGYAIRVVPGNVRVYPGNPEYIEQFGGRVPLEKFGTVVMAGQSRCPENRIATHSLRGYEFTPL